MNMKSKSKRIQAMVTPSVSDALANEAARFGYSQKGSALDFLLTKLSSEKGLKIIEQALPRFNIISMEIESDVCKVTSEQYKELTNANTGNSGTRAPYARRSSVQEQIINRRASVKRAQEALIERKKSLGRSAVSYDVSENSHEAVSKIKALIKSSTSVNDALKKYASTENVVALVIRVSSTIGANELTDLS